MQVNNATEQTSFISKFAKEAGILLTALKQMLQLGGKDIDVYTGHMEIISQGRHA